jgi:hypothetical protein
MALIAYGTRRLVSDSVVMYSFTDSLEPGDVQGVVLAEPHDPSGLKVFPLTASRLSGEAVLAKALREFRQTGEWPEAVSHVS